MNSLLFLNTSPLLSFMLIISFLFLMYALLSAKLLGTRNKLSFIVENEGDR